MLPRTYQIRREPENFCSQKRYGNLPDNLNVNDKISIKFAELFFNGSQVKALFVIIGRLQISWPQGEIVRTPAIETVNE